MLKREFIEKLRDRLSGLPGKEAEEQIDFYSEMIDDLIEEGCSEAEAVAKIGPVEKLVGRILTDIPLSVLIKDRVRPQKRLSVLTIILLSLGSPVWLALVISAFAVVISVYASVWACLVSLWATFVAVGVAAVGGLFLGVINIFFSGLPMGLMLIGASVFCLGFSIFLYYACIYSSKWIIVLTKNIAVFTKKCIIGKGRTK